MSEFEDQLKKVLSDLKTRYESGQNMESAVDEHAEKLAEILIKENKSRFDPHKNPEQSAEKTKKILQRLQDEYSVDDTLIIFRGTDEGRITGIMQGDMASIVAGLGYIINKSKIPKEVILKTFEHNWDEET